MTGNTETAVTEEPPKQSPPNLFSFFPKLNFQLPFLPPKPQPEPEPEPQPQQPNPQKEVPKPSVVRFPKTQLVLVPSSPLQAEPDADPSASVKTANPLILWQVYAVGAIMISSWIWARWNERKGHGGSPNNESAEGRHSDDVSNDGIDSYSFLFSNPRSPQKVVVVASREIFVIYDMILVETMKRRLYKP
ncbi:hypothetical protein CR513_60101, partial [Mucuna pruriens]